MTDLEEALLEVSSFDPNGNFLELVEAAEAKLDENMTAVLANIDKLE